MTRLPCIFFLAGMLGGEFSAAQDGTEVSVSGSVTATVPDLPHFLSETGLYRKGTLEVAADKIAYAPQYPLWSDAAYKRRWLYLPPGTAVDAANPDAWVFPPGARFWKEFGYAEPVETRMIERLADGSWRYSAYVWNEARTDALLAPDRGYRKHPVAAAPGGYYTIPSHDDCRACHEGTAVPILGFGALQLSTDRDPLAPNAERLPYGAADLDWLVERGLVRNLPAKHISTAPRIAAPSATARAALGYLHANCGHCHNAAGPLSDLGLVLSQGVADALHGQDLVMQTLAEVPSDFHLYGATRRVVPGQPALSVLALRMRSRNPVAQMPPLGTRTVDANATLLIERWIQEIAASDKEHVQ